MIENFEPSAALRSLAPSVTAIVYTGDGVQPVSLKDLALCVESGEVIPLNEPVFAGAAGQLPRPSGHEGIALVLADVAGLLGCESTLDAIHRAATLALLQATTAVPARRAEAALASVALSSRNQARIERVSGSLDALVAEMDAAAHARPEFAAK